MTVFPVIKIPSVRASRSRFFALFIVGQKFKAETVPVSGTASASLPFLRGLAALFLLLCGFLALLTVYRDKQNGLYARLYGTVRRICPWITMAAYLLPAGLICLTGLGISGCFTSLETELLALLCYLFTIFAFYTLLGTLIRNHTVLCAPWFSRQSSRICPPFSLG